MSAHKVIVITGAGSGIGKAAALLFAQRGGRIVVSDRHLESGQAVTDEINQQGGNAIFVPADVANYAEVAELIEQAVKQYGQLDIMINNAGIGPSQLVPTAEATLEDWDRVIAINQTGVFYGMKLALQQMVSQKEGCIINVASLAGLKASINNISYAASKFAVVGMTKAAALEYARYNIRINAVCPGYTHTRLLSQLLAAGEGMEEKLKRFIPQRRFGEVIEIAHAIAYLASPEAGFITGQTLVLDGGTSL